MRDPETLNTIAGAGIGRIDLDAFARLSAALSRFDARST
jgi:hypothetical protein